MKIIVDVFILFELCRGASESNEHHAAEIGSARETATEDVSKNSEDIIKHMEGKLLELYV